MLPNSFFNRNSVIVAKDLLGKFLVRKTGDKTFRLKIVETEAYEGLKDLASHARRGITQRNAPMFEKAGTLYVHFTYGMHWMLNIVCGPKGYPSGVLIRGVESVIGPARLTKYLAIGKELNGKKLGKASGLWIEKAKDIEIQKIKIKRTPRIGVSYAGPIWSNKKWRFVLETSTASGRGR
jgi:DNA-3-methyladenine glycosylase